MFALWLATMAPAQAQESGWRWSHGTVRTFHLESFELVPGPWQIRQRGGLQTARTNKVRSEFLLQCTAVDESDSAWELECDVLDASFIGTPVLSEDPRVLETTLKGFAELVQKGTVDITMGKDGRLDSVDLDGLNQEDRADALIVEWLRLRLMMALSGWDAEAPPTGVDGWVQNDHLWAMSPFAAMNMGGIRVEHTVSQEGSLLVVNSKARGTLPLNGSTANLEIAGLWRLQGEGTLRFDAAQGAMVQGSWGLVGLPTASVGVIEGDPYLLGGSVLLIPADAPLPDCGESGLWGDHFEPAGPENALVNLQLDMADSYDEAGFRSKPYLWAQVGPSYHFQHLRENPLGAGFTLGVRLPLALSVGVGAQWDRPARFRSYAWIEEERQVYAGVWFESNYRVTPRVGVEAGASYREFPDTGFPDIWMPFFALDLGLQWRVRPRHWVGLYSRAPIELGHLEVTDSRGNASWADNTSWVVQLAWTVKLTGKEEEVPEVQPADISSFI